MLKNVEEIINKFDDLDMDNFMTVQILVDEFKRWLNWNKTYVKIEVFESREFDTIIIAHKFFDSVKIIDSWEFLEDIKYCLNDYVNRTDDEDLHKTFKDKSTKLYNDVDTKLDEAAELERNHNEAKMMRQMDYDELKNS